MKTAYPAYLVAAGISFRIAAMTDHRLLIGSRTAVLPGGFPQPLQIADRWYAKELLVLPVKV
jgi:hypothetical protein